jgi:Ser/Thr protein kinase RdoA (MazF antagonist)
MTTLFESMTEEEQKAWWLERAKSALKQYNMADADLSWLAYTHNAVFAVKHNDVHFVLYLYRHAHVRWDRVAAIFYWMKRLHNEAHLDVPVPVITNENGSAFILALRDGTRSNMVNAVLVYRLEGDNRSGDTISEKEVYNLGQFLGKLHQFSVKASRDPNPVDFTVLTYEGLFGETGIYYPGEEAMQVFTDKQLTVMDAVAEKVKAAMDELGTGETEFGLIHGDLLLQNILFYEGEVRALDFEYCGWGYYLYDLTPLLWQLKPQARYPELEQALWDGYTSIRPLSSRHRELLERFIAGRQVASMRWVATNRHNPSYQGKVEGIMVQRAAELQGFLETGILTRK